MFTASQINEKTDIFKLLSDPTRLRILSVLLSADRELCVNEIAYEVGATASATSHQLAKLEARNIVICHRRGQTMCYEVVESPTTKILMQIIKLAT